MSNYLRKILLTATVSIPLIGINLLQGQAQVSPLMQTNPLLTLKPQLISISVANFEETIRWYQEKLGFKLVRKQEIPGIATKQAFLELNRFRIEILERDKSARLQPPVTNIANDLLIQGYKHLTFKVDNLDAVAAELKKRGVEFISEPQEVPNFNIKIAFIKDNNGNSIGLLQEL